jgi:hypothetical protein
MKHSSVIHTCKSCGSSGRGNFCSHCGQSLNTKRITVTELIREIYHYFTHIEKGFLFTLKQLVIAPGLMQRTYIQGKRNIHQKPFSMFLICATISAVSRYWIFNAIIHYYHTDIVSEAKFFHEYMVMMFILLVPVYVLITYLLFYKSGYNYAEIGVLILYMAAIFFLLAVLIGFLKLIFPHLDTVYIEFPVYIIYITITLINFFKTMPRWQVAIKSLIIITAIILINQVMEDLLIGIIS